METLFHQNGHVFGKTSLHERLTVTSGGRSTRSVVGVSSTACNTTPDHQHKHHHQQSCSAYSILVAGSVVLARTSVFGWWILPDLHLIYD